MAFECVPGVVSILRSSGQLQATATISDSFTGHLVSSAVAPFATRVPVDLVQVLEAQSTVASNAENPASLSQREVRSSLSKVRAVCGSSARTDLCGGPPERAVPTAITFCASYDSHSRVCFAINNCN